METIKKTLLIGLTALATNFVAHANDDNSVTMTSDKTTINLDPSLAKLFGCKTVTLTAAQTQTMLASSDKIISWSLQNKITAGETIYRKAFDAVHDNNPNLSIISSEFKFMIMEIYNDVKIHLAQKGVTVIEATKS